MPDKILIIESYVQNLKLISEILRCNGYEAVEAKSAGEGIEMAITENPCLILLDTQMPSWLETFKIMKSNPSMQNIPVITLSPYATQGDTARFVKFGFLDCIAKPFSLRTLVTTIDKHLKTRIANGK